MTSAGSAEAELAWPDGAGPDTAGPGAATPDAAGPEAAQPAAHQAKAAGAKAAGAKAAGAGACGGEPSFLLVLTHGAGGGVGSADLAAVRATGLRLGGAVALVTQPYRAAGRRAPGSADRQDAAWLELITALRGQLPPGTPLIQGGRSNGARVACRTARAAGARAVLALAFPLHPPGRPERSRAAELAAAGVPVLVVNGRRDPFGIPAADGHVEVVVLEGETHALSRHPEAAAEAAGTWLRGLLGRPATPAGG